MMSSLKIGDRVLLNDGKIELEVAESEPGKITTIVKCGDEICRAVDLTFQIQKLKPAY